MTREPRTRGTTGLKLDPAKLTEALQKAQPEHDLVPFGELLLVTTKEGAAVLCTEGVGWTEHKGLVSVLAKNNEPRSFQSFEVELPVEAVTEAATDEEVDLADFIRVFGDRLEANFRIWRNAVEEAS